MELTKQDIDRIRAILLCSTPMKMNHGEKVTEVVDEFVRMVRIGFEISKLSRTK